ncbi:hypothetical protein ACVWZK_002791 [Bradyrhizobium sp. GM0.4]
MLKAIAVIAILLAVGIVGVLGFALTKPDTFRVERSLAVKAPANAVYPLVADFHRWTAWSPYENRDPAMKRAFGGTAQGKGATYAWDGNNNVGAGHMEILEASASSQNYASSSISSGLSKATTPPSSPLCRKAMPHWSRGRCPVRPRSCPKSCRCSSTWTT